MISESDLKQAVILCGGLGTRLRPLTNNLPKPMVMVNGKPFLYYLLEQLAAQGIRDFLLLTGYLGEIVSEYFGDGSQYGWSITYSLGPTEWDTGRRIWEARTLLNEQFLLLYSDNFVQFNLPRLLKVHKVLDVPVSLLLAPKPKGKIKVSEDGLIEAYDKDRNGSGFDYVEVGYMIIEKSEILKDFPSYANFPDFNFSKVLQSLAKKKKIASLVVHDAYHSISDPARLANMCGYLKPKKILLIDRDGTINEKAQKGEYITSWHAFKWVPETRKAMITLAEKGFKFIVITNQAGIARNMIDPEMLKHTHKKMVDELAEIGVEVLKVYMCPDHWEEESFMRKPAPGMFFQAAKDFSLRMDHCLYVGDDERDCQAAANAGCGMIYLSKENHPPKLREFPKPFFINETLEGLVDVICSAYRDAESTF